MKRSFVLATALFLFALALVFSSPYSVVRASDPPDKCTKCLEKLERDFERCEAQNGGPSQECYDQFNNDIIHCYATVCEQ